MSLREKIDFLLLDYAIFEAVLHVFLLCRKGDKGFSRQHEPTNGHLSSFNHREKYWLQDYIQVVQLKLSSHRLEP